MDETSIERGVHAPPLAAAGAASGADAFAEATTEASGGLDGTPSVMLAFPSGCAAGDLDAKGASEAAGAPVVGISGKLSSACGARRSGSG